MKIELREWCSNYKEELISLCNEVDRSYLSGRLPFPYTEKDADCWLNMVSINDGINGVFRAIVLDGKVIGNISVERKGDVFNIDGEIGYMLFKEFKSKGYMTKAVSNVCKIAFQELNLKRITGLVYEPNIASRKILEKNGFTLEGIMKDAVNKDLNIYDLCIYGKYV